MSSSKLTMIGIYNYDPTIFENLTFPDGINKDTAVTEIIMRAGEFEVLYPQPEFLKMAITHWGTKHYRTFEKWVEALAIDFNPLYNYDRFEEYEDIKNTTGASDYTSKDSRKTSGTQSAIDQNESEGSAHDKDSHGEHSTEQRGNDYTETSGGNSVRNDTTGKSSTDIENSGAEETGGRTGSESQNAFKSTGEQNTGSSNNSQTQTALSQTGTDTDSDQTNTRKVAAYDAATYQPKEEETIGQTSGVAGDGLAITSTDDTKSENGQSAANESSMSSNNTSESENKNTSSNTIRQGDESEHHNEIEQHDEAREHNETVNTVNQTAGESAKDSETAAKSNNISQSASAEDTTGSADSSTKSNQLDQSTHKAHLYGNIGVTTSTQMLEDFIRVERFNIYENIADIFTDEFCIKVY